MKKVLVAFIALCSVLALSPLGAQTNQYFWHNNKLMFGAPIAQTDSLTFGEDIVVDTLHLLMPRTAVNVNETVFLTVHDTVWFNRCGDSITPVDPPVTPGMLPAGTLPGLFSVAADRKVRFAKGNLQFWPAAEEWRFAEHQYDYVAGKNNNIDVNYNGWIDLFGYGTSGYNGKVPTLYSSSDSNYPNSNISNTDYDWGVYATINDVAESGWRTLTNAEWVYLIETRTKHGLLLGRATVNEIKGLIILPDYNTWVLPEGLSFTAGPADWTTNIYSEAEWQQMENAGAVFLPTAGRREITTTYNTSGTNTPDGEYWSSTNNSSCCANCLWFNTTSLYSSYSANRSYGRSVRLVMNAAE